jgi:hypothetical protein
MRSAVVVGVSAVVVGEEAGPSSPPMTPTAASVPMRAPTAERRLALAVRMPGTVVQKFGFPFSVK